MKRKINKCPVCNKYPTIEYACGEYFISGTDNCRFCEEFGEMHSSEDNEITAWNNAVKEELKFKCPLGGDEANDCEDCCYGVDYHFVDGDCIKRPEV